jgi:3-oxoacyl-[acyl-carrier-protein] synthase II
MQKPRNRAVITGLGAVTPAGIGWKKNWQAILSGKSGVRAITSFPLQPGYRTTIAGEVDGFNPKKFISDKQADGCERFTQLACAATRLAIEDSGIALDKDPGGTGVVIGCGMGGLPFFEKQAELFGAKGPTVVRPSSVPRIMPNAAGSAVAALWKVRGPNFTISTACSSSNHAVGMALDLIRSGRSNRVLCGGAEALLSPITFAAFDSLRVMSRHNEKPKSACRPFDRERDGFVMGEGSIMFVLEERDSALARGAEIYAEVAGYGSSNGSFNILAPDPDGSEASESMMGALRDGGAKPTDIDYIHAHGTGTRSNDTTETRGIERAFGGHAKKLMVSSTKPVTGHMMGAAGAMGVMVCALSIKTGQVPLTLNYKTADPECPLDYVQGKSRKAAVRAALSNGFAFGSNNATILLKREDLTF